MLPCQVHGVLRALTLAVPRCNNYDRLALHDHLLIANEASSLAVLIPVRWILRYIDLVGKSPLGGNVVRALWATAMDYLELLTIDEGPVHETGQHRR